MHKQNDGQKTPFQEEQKKNNSIVSVWYENVKNGFSICSHVLGEHGIRSNYGRLTVLKSPDQPKILQGDFIVTTEDREIEIECVSENGKPAAEVHTNTHIHTNTRVDANKLKLRINLCDMWIAGAHTLTDNVSQICICILRKFYNRWHADDEWTKIFHIGSKSRDSSIHVWGSEYKIRITQFVGSAIML